MTPLLFDVLQVPIALTPGLLTGPYPFASIPLTLYRI